MIYTVDNTVRSGKPVDVFVDGEKIEGAFYADTEKGFVEYYPQPARIDPEDGGAILRREVYGNVTVEPAK